MPLITAVCTRARSIATDGGCSPVPGLAVTLLLRVSPLPTVYITRKLDHLQQKGPSSWETVLRFRPRLLTNRLGVFLYFPNLYRLAKSQTWLSNCTTITQTYWCVRVSGSTLTRGSGSQTLLPIRSTCCYYFLILLPWVPLSRNSDLWGMEAWATTFVKPPQETEM